MSMNEYFHWNSQNQTDILKNLMNNSQKIRVSTAFSFNYNCFVSYTSKVASRKKVENIKRSQNQKNKKPFCLSLVILEWHVCTREFLLCSALQPFKLSFMIYRKYKDIIYSTSPYLEIGATYIFAQLVGAYTCAVTSKIENK